MTKPKELPKTKSNRKKDSISSREQNIESQESEKNKSRNDCAAMHANRLKQEREFWKMRESKDFCDLEFRVGPNQDKVVCHKLVVAAWASNILTLGIQEKPGDVTIINVDEGEESINKDAVEAVLHFIYLKTLPEDVTPIIKGVLALAKRWKLPALQDLCNNKMVLKLDESHSSVKNMEENISKMEDDEDIVETENFPDRIQKLQSSDGDVFGVDVNICKNLSYTIWNMMLDRGIEDQNEDDEIIPLHKVKGGCLGKVIEWCLFHRDDPIRNKNIPIPLEDRKKEKRTDDICPWDWEFLQVEQGDLFEIMMAAHYLEIDGLIDVCAKKIAGMMKGKSPEELRTMFNIENDFTPQEERQIRREMEAQRERTTINIPCLENLLLKKLRFEKK